jgi:hypothetical protein
MKRLLLSALAACVLAMPSKAETISFGLINLSHSTPSVAHADVPFRYPGRVCRISVIFSDQSNQRNVSVRLFRKDILIGNNVITEFENPWPWIPMVGVTSAGSVHGTQKLSSRLISERVDPKTAFYLIQTSTVDDPTWDGTYLENDFADVVGVQIDFRPEKQGCRTP